MAQNLTVPPSTRDLVNGVPSWQPSSLGLLGASLDPALCTSKVSIGIVGQPFSTLVYVPQSGTIVDMLIYITDAGAGLVSGQCFGTLHRVSDGALLGSSPSQHTAWQSVGLSVMTLTAAFAGALTQGGPGVALAACIWANGTTTPKMIGTPSQTVGTPANLLTSGRGKRQGWNSTQQTAVIDPMRVPDSDATQAFFVGVR